MLLGIVISPYLGIYKKGGFQYIQGYTGFVSPDIFAMFILGFFWNKTTSNAALFATIGGFALSVIFKLLPGWGNSSFLSTSGFSKINEKGIYEIPFLDRMGFVFLICIVIMYVISMIENSHGNRTHSLEVDTKIFRPHTSFIAGVVLICGVLVALYAVYW